MTCSRGILCPIIRVCIFHSSVHIRDIIATSWRSDHRRHRNRFGTWGNGGRFRRGRGVKRLVIVTNWGLHILWLATVFRKLLLRMRNQSVPELDRTVHGEVLVCLPLRIHLCFFVPSCLLSFRLQISLSQFVQAAWFSLFNFSFFVVLYGEFLRRK